jgi:excisionase family DNA binding protein
MLGHFWACLKTHFGRFLYAGTINGVHEISRLTGWSPFTVYKKAAKGEIPGRFKLGKRSLRFKESEVMAWWREQAEGVLDSVREDNHAM